MSLDKHDYTLEHGIGSTLIALAVPETWFSLGERLAFAVITAIVSTLLSKAVSSTWNKITKSKE